MLVPRRPCAHGRAAERVTVDDAHGGISQRARHAARTPAQHEVHTTPNPGRRARVARPAGARPAQKTGAAGPEPGESTAPGPTTPLAPPPDAGAGELSVQLSSRPNPVASPAATSGAAAPAAPA